MSDHDPLLTYLPSDGKTVRYVFSDGALRYEWNVPLFSHNSLAIIDYSDLEVVECPIADT